MPFISEIAVLLDRSLIEVYPYYYLHSLRIPNENIIQKGRFKEIAERYFIWSDFRDIGNEKYHQKNYYEALSYHEQVLIFLSKAS